MAGPPLQGANALADEALPGGPYTWDDYRSWDDGQRWELIHGQAWAMSPAPRLKHQTEVFDLARKLADFLEGKPCQVFIAPVDGYLAEDEDNGAPDATDLTGATVVQPDLLVVCDPDKLRDDGVYGAPDFLVEILSPSTAKKDLQVKRDLYEAAGVREYWIADPDNGRVFVWVREAGGCFAKLNEYRADEPVPSAVLSGFVWGPRAG